ncbi:MAG: oligosaccharide flippase family protein [Paludibacteraceae bacterium]|nr:oligosaccharide flippase family protein [Paludibacteraceae bacterium]
MGIIAKQSLRGTIVTYLGIAVGFVTTFFVLTRFLTAEEIGLARVFIDAATLFIGLAQLGTSSSLIRFSPYFKSEDGQLSHGFFFWALVVPLIGFGLFAAIYCACHVPLAAWFGEKSPLFIHYYYLVLPLAFFMLYQQVAETSANVLMHIVLPRAVRELIVRVGLLILYLLYAFHVLSLDGLMIGICLNYGVAALINIIYLFHLGHISLRPDWPWLRQNHPLIRRYLTYTGFLIVSALAGTLAPILSSFFITAKMGLDSTGIFAIATYIAVMVSIPYRSVTAIASPQIAQTLKDRDLDQCSHLVRQVTSNLLLIGGFIMLAIWLNIDLIFHVLPNGQTYASARDVVLILSVSQLILATFSICLNTLNYSRLYALSMVYSFVLTITAMVLNSLLIPRYGMTGAAWSNLIAYALYFVLILLTVRLYGIRILHRRWYAILALLIAIFLLNMLLVRYLPIPNIWLSSILRSVILLGGGLWIAYHAQLSPEIHALLHSIRLPRH